MAEHIDPTPTTSAEHLQLAAEHIRMAMHVPGPTTPEGCYDEVGALHGIAARMQQHLDRVGEALFDTSQDPRLRGLPGADLPVEQLSLEVRGTAFRVQRVAGEKLAGLVRELNTAWSQISAFAFAATPDEELLQVTDPGEDVDTPAVEIERRTTPRRTE